MPEPFQSAKPEGDSATPSPVEQTALPESSNGGNAWRILIGINVVVFVLMAISGAGLFDPDIRTLIKWGANFAPLTMDGEYWRLLTSLFIHIGLIHIVFNMIVLMQLGPAAEALFGTRRFLILYILAGLGGGIASNCWNPGTVSAGASGALFGVVGGLLGFMLRKKDQLVEFDFKSQIKNLLLFVGYNLFIGLTHPHIDNSAHIGGLVTGYLMGFFVLESIHTSPKKIRVSEWMGVAVAIVALAVSGAIALARTSGKSTDAQTQYLLMDKVSVAKAELHYDPKIPKELVAKLGEELKTISGFGTYPATVMFSQYGERFQIGFVLNTRGIENESILYVYKQFGHQISKNIFDNKPVDLKFYDEHLVERKSFKWSRK